GYTDDTATALVGIGASAISRLPQGYAQNATGTSQHTRAIREGRFSVAKGHRFRGEDLMRARMIEALMCDFRIDATEIRGSFGIGSDRLDAMFRTARDQFGDMVQVGPEGFSVPERGRPLTRMIARTFDAYDMAKTGHSSAI